MKKYIIPALRVADIENEVILAGSNPTTGFEGGEADHMEANKRGLFDWTNDEE